MRVLYKDCAITIDLAMRDGKRLIFRTCDNLYYYTKDYFADNIAYCALNDLIVNGYIRVDELHKFVGYVDIDYFIRYDSLK